MHERLTSRVFRHRTIIKTVKLMSPYPKHLFWLDPLRFIAALMVAVSHIRGAVFVEYGLLENSSKSLPIVMGYAITRISNEAVIVFFVLSGFLVGGRALNKMLANQFDLASYACDRLSRIFVPLFPALVITAFVLVMKGESVNFIELFGNVLSLQGVFVESYGGNEPLWSLSYEVWFYVLAFGIGMACVQNHLSIAPLLILTLVFVVFCYLDAAYLLCWILGAAVYFMPPAKHVKTTLFIAVIIMLAAIAGIQLASGTRSLEISGITSWLPPIQASRIALSFGMALFIRQIILLAPKGMIAKRFDSFCSFMAKSSYTLYLTHFPLIHLVQHFGLSQSASVDAKSMFNFFGMIVLSLLFAAVCYWCFERHTNVVRQWLKQRFANAGMKSLE